MKLNEFLTRAKINTYATSGEGGETILEDGSKELVYEEEEFKYRDRYFSFNPFGGQEIVCHKGEVVWLMNYYGKVTSDIIPKEKVYEFLKKAMKQITEDRPFRGPNSFKEGKFEYTDDSKGVVESFIGTERIYYQGEEIYKLDYHGGTVKT